MDLCRFPDAAVNEMLHSALRRLQSSGIVQERVSVISLEAVASSPDDKYASKTAELAAEVRLSCALDSCGAREEHAAHFKHCAACKGPVYCCKEHQVAHWPAHKAACKAARKAAAAAAGGGAGPSDGEAAV